MAAMMMKAPRQSLAALGLALGCGVSPSSGPGSEAHPTAPLLALIDADGDGSISALEFDVVAEDPDDFETADLDGDGALGLGELTRMLWRINPSYSRTVLEGAPGALTWAGWAEHAENCGLGWGSGE